MHRCLFSDCQPKISLAPCILSSEMPIFSNCDSAILAFPLHCLSFLSCQGVNVAVCSTISRCASISLEFSPIDSLNPCSTFRILPQEHLFAVPCITPFSHLLSHLLGSFYRLAHRFYTVKSSNIRFLFHYTLSSTTICGSVPGFYARRRIGSTYCGVALADM